MRGSHNGASAAAAVILLLALLAQPAAAADRHPSSQLRGVTSLYIDEATLSCMTERALREAVLRSSRIAEQFLASGDTEASIIVVVASSGLSASLQALRAGSLERALTEAGVYAALLYVSEAIYNFELGDASIACGGLALRGPLVLILLSLVTAAPVEAGYAIILPEAVKAGRAEEATGGSIAAENPLAEELFRQELLPVEEPPIEVPLAPDQGEAAAEPQQGAPVAPGGDLDITRYLEALAGLVEGTGGAISGNQGVGVALGNAPSPWDAVGKIRLDLDSLLHLTRSLENLQLPGGYDQEVAGLGAGEGAGAALAGAGAAALAITGVAAVVFAVQRWEAARLAAARLLGSRSPEASVKACYRELLRLLEARGVPRGPGETPREVASRALRVLGPRRGGAVARATEIYEAVAYGGLEPGRVEADECWRLLEEVRGYD